MYSKSQSNGSCLQSESLAHTFGNFSLFIGKTGFNLPLNSFKSHVEGVTTPSKYESNCQHFAKGMHLCVDQSENAAPAPGTFDDVQLDFLSKHNRTTVYNKQEDDNC